MRIVLMGHILRVTRHSMYLTSVAHYQAVRTRHRARRVHSVQRVQRALDRECASFARTVRASLAHERASILQHVHDLVQLTRFMQC